MSEDERQPLISRDSSDHDHDTILSSLICVQHRRAVLVAIVVTVWVIIALAMVLCFLVLPATSVNPADQHTVRLMSLSVWGSPASFGVLDKEERMAAIGKYNNWYRQRQAQEFGQAVRASDAGNMEVDPRTSETTYTDIKRGMRDSRHEYLKTYWLDSNMATYGNTKNTYSGREGPLVFDYLLHKSKGSRSISVTDYRVNVLKTKSGKSFSNHEAIEATYSLN